MKKITLIKMKGCMYCAQVLGAIKEVKEEYPEFANIEVEVLDKKTDARAKEFEGMYHYVPSMFVEGKKVYEAHPDETYGECLLNVKKIFRAAI